MPWLLISLLAVGWVASAAAAGERSVSLVQAFQEFCSSPVPSFEEIEARADALRLRVDSERTIQAVRSKSWVLENADARYLLIASTIIRENGKKQKVCGIVAFELLGDETMADLIESLQLGAPVHHYDNYRTWHPWTARTVWKKVLKSERVSIGFELSWNRTVLSIESMEK